MLVVRVSAKRENRLKHAAARLVFGYYFLLPDFKFRGHPICGPCARGNGQDRHIDRTIENVVNLTTGRLTNSFEPFIIFST